MLQTVTTGIVQRVSGHLDLPFQPVEKEHARHLHIASTSDEMGQSIEIADNDSLQSVERTLSSGLPTPASRTDIQVYVSRLLFLRRESSLTFGYGLSSPVLGQEAFNAFTIYDSSFVPLPCIIAGELRSVSRRVPAETIQKMVNLAFESHSGIKNTPINVGPLAVTPF